MAAGMQRLDVLGSLFALASLVVISSARAQPAAGEPPATVPVEAAPSAAEVVTTVAPAAPAAPAEAGCFPACREGYLCSAGQCISACNPACAAGERCTAAASCEPSLPPPPPPAYLDQRAVPLPPPAPEAGVHTHDGFLLRASLGFGGGAMYERYDGDLFGTGAGGGGEIELAGGGLRLAIDVGSALSAAFAGLNRDYCLTRIAYPVVGIGVPDDAGHDAVEAFGALDAR